MGSSPPPRIHVVSAFVVLALVAAHVSAVHADTADGQTPPSHESEPAPAAPGGELATSEDPGVPPSYQRAIDEAVDEHERGHFAEAREHFRAAHDVFPNARTLRGLGKVEFELRNYGESVRFLSAALTSNVRPLSPELRAEVEALLERANAYVGQVHVDVQPGSASVSVDGVTVATGPQAALALLVGDHVLEFRAHGRLPERRRVRVRGGDQINVQVTLAPPELRDRAGRDSGERPVGSAPVYKKWWLWTAVGVVVAGAATAGGIAAARDQASRPAVTGGTSGVVVPNP